MHTASNNAVKARTARLTMDRGWSATGTSLRAVGRNVVSTGGTVGPAARSEPFRSEPFKSEPFKSGPFKTEPSRVCVSEP